MGIGGRARQEARKGCFVLALLVSGLLQAQPAGPTIAAGGVVNAASFLSAELPGGALAPGAIVSIFGHGFGPNTPVIDITTSSGEMFRAELLYFTAKQINAFLPPDIPIGEHSLHVVGEAPSNSVRIKVVAASFGLFHRDDLGIPVAAVQVNENGGVRLVTLEKPARPGDVITLWGTGLGTHTGPALEVLVAGRSLEPMFAGPSPCCVGVDQVSLRLPDDAPAGCVVPVAIRKGPMVSNFASLPISADGGRCQPDGPYGEVELTRSWSGFGEVQPADSADASFATRPSRISPDRLAPHGSCMAWDGRAVSRWFDTGAFSSGPDAGALDVATPAAMFQLRREDDYGLRSELPEQFLGAGAYWVSTSGGPDFPAFTASIQANPAPLVEQPPAFSFGRMLGDQVTWTGGAPDDDLVIWSRAEGGDIDLVCRARVADESFMIPQPLFANLREGDGFRTVSIGVLQSAPLEFETDGLERGVLIYRERYLFDSFLGPTHLASTPVVLPDGSEIQAELAANFGERQRGLMFREFMPADQGMLFLFDTSANWRFWMLNTLIPLDILWMNEDREIVYISADTPPCPSGNSCPTYGPNEASRYVLELNAGEAARRGLAVGDRLDW